MYLVNRCNKDCHCGPLAPGFSVVNSVICFRCKEQKPGFKFIGNGLIWHICTTCSVIVGRVKSRDKTMYINYSSNLYCFGCETRNTGYEYLFIHDGYYSQTQSYLWCSNCVPFLSKAICKMDYLIKTGLNNLLLKLNHDVVMLITEYLQPIEIPINSIKGMLIYRLPFIYSSVFDRVRLMMCDYCCTHKLGYITDNNIRICFDCINSEFMDNVQSTGSYLLTTYQNDCSECKKKRYVILLRLSDRVSYICLKCIRILRSFTLNKHVEPYIVIDDK